MMGRLGVYPHNMTVCSALTADGLLFVLTSNGVNETHAQVPAPGAPSFVALDRDTADVVWTDNSPGGNILHGQWASPAYGVFDGQAQVLFPGGDGWLYSFDPRGDGQGHARLLWKFDTNRKASKYVIGNPKRNRNPLAAAPCIDDGLVYVAGGDEPERGQGPGELWCIDPTRRGDISLELAVDQDGKPLAPRRLQCVDPAAGERAIPNPNSAVVWHFDVMDSNNDGQIQYEEQFYGSLSTPVVCDGVIYAPDFAGFVHCLDAKTGRAYWHFDSYSTFWASALVVDGKVYIGSEMGELLVFRHSSQPVAADGQPLAVIDMGNSVFATPIVANNVLYVTRKNMLFAIARPGANDQTGQESP
jgi:outer membrane protein assembly factor BamB